MQQMIRTSNWRTGGVIFLERVAEQNQSVKMMSVGVHSLLFTSALDLWEIQTGSPTRFASLWEWEWDLVQPLQAPAFLWRHESLQKSLLLADTNKGVSGTLVFVSFPPWAICFQRMSPTRSISVLHFLLANCFGCLSQMPRKITALCKSVLLLRSSVLLLQY